MHALYVTWRTHLSNVNQLRIMKARHYYYDSLLYVIHARHFNTRRMNVTVFIVIQNKLEKCRSCSEIPVVVRLCRQSARGWGRQVGRVKGHENWLGWNLTAGVLFLYTYKGRGGGGRKKKESRLCSGQRPQCTLLHAHGSSHLKVVGCIS
jgi:hypothetical protein